MHWKIALIAVAVSGAMALLAGWTFIRGQSGIQYRTATVEHGANVASGSPNGDVHGASQASGTILAVNANYNTTLTRGGLIGRIDAAAFQTKVDHGQMNLQAARTAAANTAAGVRAQERIQASNAAVAAAANVVKTDAAQASYDAGGRDTIVAPQPAPVAQAEKKLANTQLPAGHTLVTQFDASLQSTGSSLPDAHQIVEASIAATQRHWQARLHYTYLERDEDRRLDSEGRVKSKDVDVSRTFLVHGVPFEQLIERNGRPPSAEERRKQNEKFDRLKRETPEQRAERLRTQEEENTSLVRDVPKAFGFRLVGEEVLKGRPAYVLQATPHPGYHAAGKYGKMFARLGGKLWVDKQDFGWIKVDGEVIQPFSIGLFLVRLLRGSHITMDQKRVDDGIWMPEHVEVRAAARVLFVKNVVINRFLTYSEYKLAEADEVTARDPLNTIR